MGRMAPTRSWVATMTFRGMFCESLHAMLVEDGDGAPPSRHTVGRPPTPLDRKRDYPITVRYSYDEAEHWRREAAAHDVPVATFLYALTLACAGQSYGPAVWGALRDILSRLPKRVDGGSGNE